MTRLSPTSPADGDLPLRDDGSIVIRPARREDAADLMALYDALDIDGRNRRFFSSYHPDRAFFTALASVGERGGARLVAVLIGAPPVEDRIIGDAGYTMLPSGNGEFAIVVARRWQRIGPYLLDALLETAARAGVSNLEADVLTVDGPMLVLLRSRGSVVMEHDGWSVVRLLIGTGDRTPTWPVPRDRPRVRVECAGGRWPAEEQARAAAGAQVEAMPSRSR